jgi:hypothetical protein
VTPESPSFTDRLRAGLASLLSGLAAGARNLEAWTARGSRPILLGLVAIAILVVGTFAIAHEGPALFGWHGERHERSEFRRRPEGKLQGKPELRSEGRSEFRTGGRPQAPRPPAPPAPPQPPTPPQPPAQ